MSAAGALLERISEEVVLRYARELVRRPSVNPPGEYAEVSRWAADEMRRIGLEVTTLEGEPGRTNVVGRLAGTGGGDSLCLAAHTDVVSVGDLAGWTYDPFAAEVVDGVLWGRGPADSKGMLAGMMAAVSAFTESGVRPRGDLYVVAYVDDEIAGPFGLRHVFDRGLVTASNLVLGEATSLEIQHLFKGRIWFGIDAIGRSSHGAFPERGVNAIDRACALMTGIRGIPLRRHPLLGGDTVSVGMISGGEQVNVACGRCRVWFDIRWGPPRTTADIRREVGAAIERVRAEHGDFSVSELEVTEERDPLEFTADSPLVRALQGAAGSVLGREVGLGGWYSSGELWPVWRAGHIAHGAVIGPGEPWQAHAVDEHVPVSELVAGARIYALTALEVCGGD